MMLNIQGGMAARVFLGTAGWAVPRAVADRFDGDGSALVRYARRFDASEINSTFWRRHKPGTFLRWRESVPEQFRFAVKLPRTVSHDAELVGTRSLLVEFLGDIEPLGERLGPLLLQLPPSLAFDDGRVNSFLRTFRALHAGAVACEPRHASWFVPRADALLAAHGVALSPPILHAFRAAIDRVARRL